MSSQAEIREAFVRDLRQAADGRQAWLIKGDFDRFKQVNDRYGCLIADTLLDWSLEALETALGAWARRSGTGAPLVNVMGDDLTIYLPPACLAPNRVAELLHGLQQAIRRSFWRRYAAGRLPLGPEAFAGLPPAALEVLQLFLERQEVTLDFAPHPGGCLALFPVRAGQSLEAAAGQAAALIEGWLGRAAAPQPANAGFVCPPSISFGGCAARPGDEAAPAGSLSEDEARQWYARLAAASQAALRACKAGGQGVALVERPQLQPVDLPGAAPLDPAGAWSRLRWSSERRLRQRLYFQPLARCALFQINPVYSYPGMALDPALIERYRGNAHGLGLKGLNELFGQPRADAVIRRLVVSCAEILVESLERRGFPLQALQAALFVDRFTLAAGSEVFPLDEIIAAGQALVERFNRGEPEIRLAQLRVSAAQAGSAPTAGYLLLEQLALTGLCQGPAGVAWSDERLELRLAGFQFCQAGGL